MSTRRVTIIRCDRCGHESEFGDARSRGKDLCESCFDRRAGGRP